MAVVGGNKMYCPNCGTELPDNSAFCANCGAKLGPASNAPVYPAPPYPDQQYGQPYGANVPPQKNEIISIILAFLVPGLGHIYLGKIMRGIAFLVGSIGISLLSSIVLWSYAGGMIMTEDPNFWMSMSSDMWIALIAILLVGIVIWIVNMVDVYQQTKKYNEAIRMTGKAPW